MYEYTVALDGIRIPYLLLMRVHDYTMYAGISMYTIIKVIIQVWHYELLIYAKVSRKLRQLGLGTCTCIYVPTPNTSISGHVCAHEIIMENCLRFQNDMLVKSQILIFN